MLLRWKTLHLCAADGDLVDAQYLDQARAASLVENAGHVLEVALLTRRARKASGTLWCLNDAPCPPFTSHGDPIKPLACAGQLRPPRPNARAEMTYRRGLQEVLALRLVDALGDGAAVHRALVIEP